MQAFLIRHCASSGQSPDAPLTAEGHEQAQRLSDWLAAHPVDHVVASPYLRARQTIEPFVARSGLPLHVDERLAERRLSPAPIEGWREVVATAFADSDHRIPGGESGRETLARGQAAVASIVAAGHRLPLLVSHGQLLSLVLHAIDARFGFAGWESLSNPDVYRIESEDGRNFRFERLWGSSEH